MSVKRLVPIHTTELSSDPLQGVVGAIYYNSVAQELRVYTGTEWKPVGGAETGLLIHEHTYDGEIYSVQAVTTAATFVDGGTPQLTGQTELNIVDGGAP